MLMATSRKTYHFRAHPRNRRASPRRPGPGAARRPRHSDLPRFASKIQAISHLASWISATGNNLRKIWQKVSKIAGWTAVNEVLTVTWRQRAVPCRTENDHDYGDQP